MWAACVLCTIQPEWSESNILFHSILSSMSFRECDTLGIGTIGVGISPMHPKIKRYIDVAT